MPRDAMRAPERPRDALGRPLPHGAVGVPPAPVEALPPDEALAAAQRYWDEGRAFAAHEMLEAVWKATAGDERDLWQGLAQLAVGYTHLQRGNRQGGCRLLRRGAAKLARHAGQHPHGIRVDELHAWASETARTWEEPGRELPAPGTPEFSAALPVPTLVATSQHHGDAAT